MKVKFLPLISLLTLSFYASAQNVAINTDGSTANSSSMLDIKSTTKGVLIPRMTAAQKAAITTPATGLLVYQTDGTSGFYYNSGSPASPVWQYISTGTAGPQGPAGEIGINYRGAYSSSVNSYSYRDAVTYSGSYYMYINSTPGLVGQTPNAYPSTWALLASAGATGATGLKGDKGDPGDGFANGTTGGQMILTNSSAPYAPGIPVNMSGDATLNAGGVITIGNNKIVGAKIADDAVTSTKIASNAVTIAKLPAGATSITYLRGDGTWAAPSGGGAVLDLVASTSGNTQTFTAGAITDVIFSTTTAPSKGSFNGTTYTVNEAGIYMVNAALTTTSATVFSISIVTSNGNSYGSPGSGATAYPTSSKAFVSANAVFSLTTGQTIKIQAITPGAITLSADNASRFTITKL